MDVAEAIGPNCSKPIIGIRPGEKVHEEMITPSDSFYTYDLGKYYTILPATSIILYDGIFGTNNSPPQACSRACITIPTPP